MIHFAHPIFFFLLLSIIPLYFLGRKSGGRIKFSSLEVIKSLKKKGYTNPKTILFIIRAFAICFFVVTLARPQLGKKFTKINTEGVDIMLLIDTSGSMEAMDFFKEGKRVNRLVAVKDAVRDFIKNRPGDRLGLIVFGEEAYTQCPLTTDHGILLDFLDKIEIGMAGERATAVGSAIGVGLNRMKDLKAKSKVMILLTDGRNNAGRLGPLKAAELAKTFKVKVYTIGAGTNKPAPFLVDGFFGKTFQYQKTDLDEVSLKKIAMATGAQYFRATDREKLKEIYGAIDKMEKTEKQINEYTEYNEIFHWFLIPGILLLLMEIILGQTRLRKIP